MKRPIKSTTTLEATALNSTLLSINLIDGGNYRKSIDLDRVKDLIESIRQRGVLQPIKVRPKGKRFELVYGSRRLMACSKLKMEAIPAIVAELTDAEAAHEALIENMQREGVDPVEESDGLHKLAELHGITGNVKALADMVMKSEQTVARLLKLNTLIDEARQDLADGCFTMGHAMELCVLDPVTQRAALTEGGVYETEWSNKSNKRIPDKDHLRSVARLKYWLEQKVVTSLSKATWKLDADGIAGVIACNVCPQRSGPDNLLFADSKENLCHSPSCFRSKMQATLQSKAAELKAAGIKAVPITNQNHARLEKGDGIPKDVIPRRPDWGGDGTGWVKVDSKNKCDSTVKGLVYQEDIHSTNKGTPIGQVIDICYDLKCKDHGANAKKGKSTSKSAAPDPKEVAEKAKRKQELFDAKVAEPVRLRVLEAITRRIPNGFDLVEYEHVPYMKRAAWEHFKRIPSDTQNVIYDALGWTPLLAEMAKKKTTDYYYSSERAKLAESELFDKLDTHGLFRFTVMCSIAHYAENLGQIHNGRDQSQIIALAEEHGIFYKLLDARERVRQSSKKLHSHHSNYLMEVILGRDVKPPSVVGSDYKVMDPLTYENNYQAVAKGLPKEPRPHLDGPEGIAINGMTVEVVSGPKKGLKGKLVECHNLQLKDGTGCMCKIEYHVNDQDDNPTALYAETASSNVIYEYPVKTYLKGLWATIWAAETAKAVKTEKTTKRKEAKARQETHGKKVVKKRPAAKAAGAAS